MLESNNKNIILSKAEKTMFEINTAPEGNPLSYKELNEQIHQAIKDNHKEIILNNVCGQRFIAASLQGDLKLIINGLPGNDLGIFMDGPKIIVNGNCEDQAGNTMNDGTMIIHGNTGDVIGLSARGGKIYIKKDVGYRVGIHIKEYENKFPILIFGGIAKNFLGEYMAGGVIIALGLKFLPDGTITENEQPICGKDLGTGIHRGMIVLRTTEDLNFSLGKGAKLFNIDEKEMNDIEPYLQEYCNIFKIPYDLLTQKPFKVIKPISKRPFGGNYCGEII
jgi:glutamate synthase domain-containing protein 3